MLVNSAGIGVSAPLLQSDVDKMEEMIKLNVSVLVRLTYAAAIGFVTRGKGTIINISSSVAIGPETLNGVFGATKAFVLAFSQSLRHELEGKGVRVQACMERENLAGDAKGKGASGSNREAESTDAPERGGLPRSSDETGKCRGAKGAGHRR